MTGILCHMNDVGFTSKPTDIKFMGRLRDKMIQKPWDYLDEKTFLKKVTTGHAFYGNIFQHRDLFEFAEGRQRQCWRAQTIVAVDIDKCTISPRAMCRFYTDCGYIPWVAYTTFSDDPDSLRSYRLMWRVEVDHRVTYEQWSGVIKGLSGLTEHGDKRARDCSRLWQGTHDPLIWYVEGLTWTHAQLAERLGL